MMWQQMHRERLNRVSVCVAHVGFVLIHHGWLVIYFGSHESWLLAKRM